MTDPMKRASSVATVSKTINVYAAMAAVTISHNNDNNNDDNKCMANTERYQKERERNCNAPQTPHIVTHQQQSIVK